jgi:hypothetical protein
MTRDVHACAHAVCVPPHPPVDSEPRRGSGSVHAYNHAYRHVRRVVIHECLYMNGFMIRT